MKRSAIVVLLMLACGDDAYVRTPTFDPGSDNGSGVPCDVAQVLSNECTACHGTIPSNGAPFSLMTRQDLIANAPQGGLVVERCLARMKDSEAPMPPMYTGQKASDYDIDVIDAWIRNRLYSDTCMPTEPSAAGGGGEQAGGAGGGSGGGGASGGSSGGSAGGSAGGASGGSSGGSSGAGGGGGSTTTNMYCHTCAATSECGGNGNVCIAFSFGNYCGTDCSGGKACGANQRCVTLTSGAMNCVPATGLTCTGTSGTGGGSGAGGGSGSSSCTPDTWASYGQSFFSNTCASCHHHVGQFGTQSYVQGRLSTIKSEISAGYMPEGTTLSSSARSRILTYLNCGAP